MKPHQLQFPVKPGPSGPEGIAEATQILRAGTFLPDQRGNPRKWGPGKGEYEHEVLIWSRPRGRFAYFAAMGKVGRRPQAAKYPPAGNETALSSPPHPPQCAHWGTFPPGGRLTGG